MRVIFSEKGQKKGQKRAKYSEIWAKITKYFETGQPHPGDYRRHETARICPGGGSDFKVNKSRYKQCGVTP